MVINKHFSVFIWVVDHLSLVLKPQLCKSMNSGVKSDNMTKSIICCTPMKKEEIIKAADKPRQPM
jgi:hypothetical protein